MSNTPQNSEDWYYGIPLAEFEAAFERFPFGKYAQKNVRDILDEDPKYCVWWLHAVLNHPLHPLNVELILTTSSSNHSSTPEYRYEAHTVYDNDFIHQVGADYSAAMPNHWGC